MTTISIRSFVLSALIAIFLSFPITATAQDDLPAGVSNSQNPADVSLTPQQSLGKITVPDGFSVTLFAGEPDIRRPIAFDFDDRGRLWVVENYSHPYSQKKTSKNKNPDRIIILEDTDNDGTFDKRKVFWSGGRYLSAIAYGHGGVWVGNSPELSFIPDRNNDDVPDSDPVVVLDGFVESNNNVLNNFHWGPDGWLYGAIGLRNLSLVGKPGTAKEDRVSISRGIWRMHPVSHKFEAHAIGMVNPWGADFNEFGDLFTSNTVISHLWHIVPGMYLQRRGNEADYQFAYQRIQSINDHLHWGGGKWTDSRQSRDGKTTHKHSVAGGGHAHCGGMVYLGDNWPKEYRGKFFTCNLHGNRVNADNLVSQKSTYVGTHGDDFFFANDSWFRGLTIKYGPDGGVYITDWHDFGECHDNDGSHRTSGRIYKVIYGDAVKTQSIDLGRKSNIELIRLQQHPNAWHARHARRLLHERFSKAAKRNDGDNSKSNTIEMRKMTEGLMFDRNTEHQLNGLWTRYVTGDADERFLRRLLKPKNSLGSGKQHLRRWAIRLLVDQATPSAKTVAEFTQLARLESSSKVRLALAVALQRIPEDSRWLLAQALLSRKEDANDPCIPLMIWYGIEPVISADTERSLKLATESKIPLVREFVARRILDTENPPIGDVVAAALATEDDSIRFDFLRGMRSGLSSRSVSPPKNWQALYSAITNGSKPKLKSVAVDLARAFGDQQAIADLKNVAMDRNAELEKRVTALNTLLKLKGALSAATLHTLLGESNSLRTGSLQALAFTNDRETPAALAKWMPELSAVQRQSAASVLVSRANFVPKLLGAIADGQMAKRDVSAYSLQQLRAYKDEKIQKSVAQLWPAASTEASKADEITRFKNLLTEKYLSAGDASAGRKVFDRNCAQCHMLFGAGKNVGPDLTGSGRANLDYVLSNLVTPSALVDSAYRLSMVQMDDGRLLSGFMVRHGESEIVLRTQDDLVTLPLEEIEEMRTSNLSMMPEGLLRSFSDEQIRDLVVYLRSADQVPLPLQE